MCIEIVTYRIRSGIMVVFCLYTKYKRGWSEMYDDTKIVHSKVVTEATKEALKRRGVTLEACR